MPWLRTVKELERAVRAISPSPLFVFAIIASFFAFPASGAAWAQEPVSAEIYEFGIYSLGPITLADPPSDYGVPRLYGNQITLLESTHEVPGQLNVSFGVRYVVHGGVEGQPIPITLVVRYPPQGLYNPERSGPSYTDELTLPRISGEESFITWDFLEPWHIEPGIWTIELWYGDQKLDEEWFKVITPPIS